MARVDGPTESACRTVLAREARTLPLAPVVRVAAQEHAKPCEGMPRPLHRIQRKLSSCHLPKHLLAKNRAHLGDVEARVQRVVPEQICSRRLAAMRPPVRE